MKTKLGWDKMEILQVVLTLFVTVFIFISLMTYEPPKAPYPFAKEKTLNCGGKMIAKTTGNVYIDNRSGTWRLPNGSYTPAGGEICVLVLDNGEDK